jgi:hypothetical protein
VLREANPIAKEESALVRNLAARQVDERIEDGVLGSAPRKPGVPVAIVGAIYAWAVVEVVGLAVRRIKLIDWQRVRWDEDWLSGQLTQEGGGKRARHELRPSQR